MTKEELLERVRAWLLLPYPTNRQGANAQELNTLYQAITGKAADCSSCTNWLIRMAAKLREFEASPELFKVQPTQKQIMAEASKKYKPSKLAIQNNVSTVVLNHNGTSEAIKLSEMTDAQAERILKNKRFAHNVEKVETKEAKADAPKTSSKKASTAKATTAAKDTAKATETKAEDTAKD